jgi:hypothetical protein
VLREFTALSEVVNCFALEVERITKPAYSENMKYYYLMFGGSPRSASHPTRTPQSRAPEGRCRRRADSAA